MLHGGLRGHVAPCVATSHDVPAIPGHPALCQVHFVCSFSIPGGDACTRSALFW